MSADYEWNLWNPKIYLDTYFSALGKDSYSAWEFLIRSLKKVKKPLKILDFGSGPTIFSIIPAAPYASEIHMCDYLDVNLREIRSWIEKEQGAYNWQHCIAEVLKLEGLDPNQNLILTRENDIRAKIKSLKHCDASSELPLGIPERFPLVISTYCIDSATSSKDVWSLYLKNLLNVVDEGGLLLLTALRNCKEYSVGRLKFPSANINEFDLSETLLSFGISKKNFSIETTDHVGRENDGIENLMFASIQVNRIN